MSKLNCQHAQRTGRCALNFATRAPSLILFRYWLITRISNNSSNHKMDRTERTKEALSGTYTPTPASYPTHR